MICYSSCLKLNLKLETMKIVKSKVEEAITQRCYDLGLKTDESNGHYAVSSEENLLRIKNWNTIEAELNKGQGNELNPKSGLPKFNAFHSSSALGVNNFSFFKEKLDQFEFLGFKDFLEAVFEKKLPTGISTPNLDFYVENANSILGFESKFIETLSAKLPNHEGNLTKYVNRFNELKNTPDDFINLIQSYIDITDKQYLDVAQLIKHSIGLLNKANDEDKDPILVYIYWVPTNWKEFELYRQHEIEIAAFKNDISRHLTFISMSYLDFWSLYENNTTFSSHIKEVMNRYKLII